MKENITQERLLGFVDEMIDRIDNFVEEKESSQQTCLFAKLAFFKFSEKCLGPYFQGKIYC